MKKIDTIPAGKNVLYITEINIFRAKTVFFNFTISDRVLSNNFRHVPISGWSFPWDCKPVRYPLKTVMEISESIQTEKREYLYINSDTFQ